MHATIRKEFKFEAAHHLVHHDGMCAFPHGHSYRVEVFAQGPVRELDPANPHPKSGMVLDFSHITAVWKKELEPILDHHDLNASTELPVTSAECLAAYILVTMHVSLPEVFKVRVHETATGYAEVTLDDLDLDIHDS